MRRWQFDPLKWEKQKNPGVLKVEAGGRLRQSHASDHMGKRVRLAQASAWKGQDEAMRQQA